MIFFIKAFLFPIFINFTFRNDEIRADDCYWLSRDYYEDACNFFRRKTQMKS